MPETAALLERMCSAEVAAVACTYREQHWLRGEQVVEVLHVAPDRWAVADASGPVWWADGARTLVRSSRGVLLERSYGAVQILTALQACLRPARLDVCWQLVKRRELHARVEAVVHDGRAAHRLEVTGDRGTVQLVVDDAAAIVLSVGGDRFTAELTDVDLDPSIPDVVFQLGDAW